MEQFFFHSVREMMPAFYLVSVDFVVVIVAVAVDFVSGVMMARRRGVSRTSRGFRRSVTKLSNYMMLMLSMVVVDVIVVTTLGIGRASGSWSLPVVPWFSSLAALALTIIEAKSVSENTGSGDLHRDITALSRRLLSRLLKL